MDPARSPGSRHALAVEAPSPPRSRGLRQPPPPRQQKLAQMLSRLTKIAKEFNVVVYFTNQVIADPGGGMFITDPKRNQQAAMCWRMLPPSD
ncbi:Meiotic recombination protein DMC1 [Zea mays]|uniref:Meiotic recombination protein DMC1 n=1 Tax=Zea mays TaxID=4577 RepID=A0A3L6EBP8_MAIZE|nr:Meiotic recombination protein DMC1 [Zea mays]